MSVNTLIIDVRILCITMITIILSITSCKYPFRPSSVFEFCRPLQASVRSFISIHQVAPATALPLLLLLLCYWYCCLYFAYGSLLFVRCRRHEFYYTAHIDKWPWPWTWPWLKHSLGQHESLCQVWSWSAQPFGRPSATDKQINRRIAFYYVDGVAANNGKH